MGSRPLVMIAAAFLALAAGTCHSDDDADSTSDRTTTTVSPESEVETAYLAFWDMAVRLAGSPDPNDPEIAQRASGDALANGNFFQPTLGISKRRHFEPASSSSGRILESGKCRRRRGPRVPGSDSGPYAEEP